MDGSKKQCSSNINMAVELVIEVLPTEAVAVAIVVVTSTLCISSMHIDTQCISMHNNKCTIHTYNVP